MPFDSAGFVQDKYAAAKTAFEANFEKGDITQNLPRTSPPNDYLTPWFLLPNDRQTSGFRFAEGVSNDSNPAGFYLQGAGGIDQREVEQAERAQHGAHDIGQGDDHVRDQQARIGLAQAGRVEAGLVELMDRDGEPHPITVRSGRIAGHR